MFRTRGPESPDLPKWESDAQFIRPSSLIHRMLETGVQFWVESLLSQVLGIIVIRQGLVH